MVFGKHDGVGGDYLKQISVVEQVKFFVAADPGRVFEGAMEKFKGKASKLVGRTEVLEQLHALWASEGIKWRGYSYKSLNPFGDINVNRPVSYGLESNYGLTGDLRLSAHFLRMYKKIDKLVEQYDGSLYLTFPATIRNPLFDLSRETSVTQLEKLMSKLQQNGIRIRCNPVLFNLDRSFFFDTNYHLNKDGALLYSSNLAECLNLTGDEFGSIAGEK